MAEAVANHCFMRDPRQAVTVDSAGTHAVHAADADARARNLLRLRGYELPRRRARSVVDKDFEQYDLILAMDSGNLTELIRRCPEPHQHKLRLFMSLADPRSGNWPIDVPDPYYGNTQGFEKVLDLCEAGAEGLLTLDFTSHGQSGR